MSSAHATILAVDDTTATLKLLAMTLSAAGYSVLQAHCGQRAFASIRENRPDLILLDLRMKGMSGLEVCRRLKSDESTRNIPIILISAFADEKEWVEGLSLGAVDYINKPFQPVELLSRVKTHIALAKMHIALHVSEEKYRNLFQNAGVAMLRTSLDNGVILDVNNKICEMYGGPREELLGKPSALLWADQSEREEALRRIKENGHVSGFEHKAVNKKGTIMDCLTSIRLYREEGICEESIVDISEFKRAEEALRDANEQLNAVFVSSPLALIILDPDGNVMKWNPAAEKIFGWSEQEVLGKFIPFVPADKLDENRKLRARVLSGEAFTGAEASRRKKDGSPIEISISTAPMRDADGTITGIMSVNMDITERKKSETVMQNVQKLESLGVLAGGIAHDFNNLLGGIFGYIDLAADTTTEKPIANYLTKALSAIHRARALTHQLLTFAKGGEPVKKIEHFSPFIEDTARFALSGSNCSCGFRIAKNLWQADFDRNQIGQVIDNIVINAQQAMPSGGAIHISASNVTFTEKTHAIREAGNYVKISFADRGIGMPEEILPRIFDPFFTTKPKGHGLGLATCYSIIKRHGGCIDVESKPGAGSTFHVYLPALSDVASIESGAAPCRHSGSGVFLVMDDEEVIRETVGDMLKSFGYAVVYSQNGREAVDVFTSENTSGRSVAGMIFDLTVPGGSGGKAAVAAIRKIDRNVPVFVSSGYADDPVMSNPEKYGFTASIHKPIRKIELAEILNRHLKRPG